LTSGGTLRRINRIDQSTRILVRNFIAASLANTTIDPIGELSLNGASLPRYQDFPFSWARGMSSDIAPGSNLETACTALSDGPCGGTRVISRARGVTHAGARRGGRGAPRSSGFARSLARSREGQLEIFAGGTKTGIGAAGVRSAAPPAALRRSCITGHRINPKPRPVLGQHRRPQIPRLRAGPPRPVIHLTIPRFLIPRGKAAEHRRIIRPRNVHEKRRLGDGGAVSHNDPALT